MADLAGGDQIVQCADDFFGRRDAIPGVQQIQVDVIGLEATQRTFQRAHDVLAAVAARVRIARFGVVGELGGQHHAVAHPDVGDESAQQAFALAAGVEVGGVDEIAADGKVAIEHRARNALVGTPAPILAEGHGAEGKAADAQA